MGTKNTAPFITCTKYKDELVFRIYDLAKSGYALNHIAKSCGVTKLTIRNWFKKHPIAKEAYLKGKKYHLKEDNSNVTFMDYVQDKLPLKIKAKYDFVTKLGKKTNGYQRVQAFLMNQETVVQQSLFIHALVACEFNKAEALRRIGLPYKILYKWMHDEEFSTLVEFLHDLRGDYFEDRLSGLIATNDARAIIFANRTFNRKRGYGDRVDVKVESDVKHHHTLSLEEAQLSIHDRKRLLNQLRSKHVDSSVVGEPIKSLPSPQEAP